MTMDVEINPSVGQESSVTQNVEKDRKIIKIIDILSNNEEIVFKSQQRGEKDLTKEEKSNIALEIYDNNKITFLNRFGKYLSIPQLKYFEKYINEIEDIDLILKDLLHTQNEKLHGVDVKNRRFEALKEMVEKGSYFSDTEMMKRNPLLYEQLVGQYLTLEEKKARDKEKMYEQQTFVKIIMEGIERDDAEVRRKKEEEHEDCEMEDSDDDSEDEDMKKYGASQPTFSQWGEFEDEQKKTSTSRKKSKVIPFITAEERVLLKEEFITSMYQRFLDGKDEDFDYQSVDNNCKYDNVEEMEQDEEEKYFDSEEPANAPVPANEESSEDELDIFMNAISNNSISELSHNMKDCKF